eukprot:TRINITY_DN8252_c0_g1_i1.p1 TRINITY_DN8252_c0_g1~~TRINITY_DN8252_c0_g1_i1.p1  ORF type:complete len:519 (+),score=105.47 TRINITY_DN8252_c0_g1_i1:39-1595(+)
MSVLLQQVQNTNASIDVPDVASSWEINMDDIELDKRIGGGSFGDVYCGKYFGTEVAIKKIKKEDKDDLLLRKYVKRELAVSRFSHPNLVGFIGVADVSDFVYLVTEFVSGGNLRTRLKSNEDISWRTRIKASSDAAKGLAYLHAKGVIHRDIKSKNCLVDENWKVKVCDFGFARAYNKKRSHMSMCGTEDWMAPEVIQGLPYDEKADVFSYGIVLCEILTRMKVATHFQRLPQDAFALDEDLIKSRAPIDAPKQFLDLALWCCNYYPDARPTIVQVIKALHEIPATSTASAAVPSSGLGKAVSATTLVVPTTPQKSSGNLLNPGTTPQKSSSSTVTTTGSSGRTPSPVNQRRPGSAYGQSTKGKKTDLSCLEKAGLTLVSPDEYSKARDDLDEARDGWLLIGYTGNNTLALQDQGKNIAELVDQLKDNEIQYGLIMLQITTTNQSTGIKENSTRAVFVNWVGPNVTILQKGKKKTHIGALQKLMQPYHAELVAVSKERFTEATLKERSAPLSGSHVID